MSARYSRDKAARLESILRSHDAFEQRTLADLRVAGFNFRTIDQANRYRKAQRTLARMSSEDAIEFVAVRAVDKW